MDHITVGVDVSKAHLDAHLAPEGRAARFTNDPDGIRQLIRWIGDAPVGRIAYEPTGRWHRPLEAALLRAGAVLKSAASSHGPAKESDMPQAEPQPLPVRSGKARSFAPAKLQREPQVRAGASPPAVVHYPDSDGEPMGESFLHIDVAADARAVLVAHHIDRPDACVGCNNFVCYEEGNTEAVVVPDVFVVFGVPKRTDRRVFKVWEEGAVPDFVLEVTSKKTRRNDEREKKDLYERLGVPEYWQFDPTGDYLDPILKGRALGADGRYRELELEDRDGGLCRFSEVLGLDLRLEDERLRFFDPKRGEYLLAPTEQHHAIQEQHHAIQEQHDTIQEQRRALEERDRALKEQHQALEAAEARIRELERQRRPEG